MNHTPGGLVPIRWSPRSPWAHPASRPRHKGPRETHMTDFATTTLPASCWDIPCAPEAVAKARCQVRDTLTEWGMPALVDSAEVVISELLTNAIQHGAAPIILALSAIGPAAVAGSVADGGPEHLRLPPAEPDLDATSGRGLAIVAALVSSWGRWPDSGGIGKTVWFTLTAPADGDAP